MHTVNIKEDVEINSGCSFQCFFLHFGSEILMVRLINSSLSQALGVAPRPSPGFQVGLDTCNALTYVQMFESSAGWPFGGLLSRPAVRMCSAADQAGPGPLVA